MNASGDGAPDDERERVLALVRLHGWNATAFQTVGEGYRYFFAGEEACVAYVETKDAWVAAGAPIGADERRADAARAFVKAAHAAGRRCCFFAAEARLLQTTRGLLRGLHIGEQPVWDPRAWRATLASHARLREQLRRARAKGVAVRWCDPSELETGPTRVAITELVEGWLAARGMAPMQFLVSVQPFARPRDRRTFVAEQNGRLVALAGVVPVPARDGWFIEDLLRAADAPNGTTELLVDHVMRWALERGSSWVTLGLAPLAGDVGRVLRVMRRLTRPLYDFDGLRAYKAKLRPNSWVPLYIAYPPGQSAVRALLDGVSAFAPGGVVKFAVRSLMRKPRLAVGALTMLLIPWTALLALAPAERWYGTSAIKWSWVAFDVALASCLAWMLKRPARSSTAFTAALAVAVSCDAALTVVQAIGWNLRQVVGGVDLVVVIAACTGPTAAAWLLWALARSPDVARSSRRA